MILHGIYVIYMLLAVIIKAEIIALSSNHKPSVGKSYSLFCKMTGDEKLESPSITYKWFKNGDLYEDSEAILPFDHLAFHDNGRYTCQTFVTSNMLSRVVNTTSIPFSLIFEGSEQKTCIMALHYIY